VVVSYEHGNEISSSIKVRRRTSLYGVFSFVLSVSFPFYLLSSLPFKHSFILKESE
jgi:hypothetical protein